MRNFNYLPIITKNGTVEFILRDSVDSTSGLLYICTEKEIQYSPEYYYNKYKEKYA